MPSKFNKKNSIHINDIKLYVYSYYRVKFTLKMTSNPFKSQCSLHGKQQSSRTRFRRQPEYDNSCWVASNRLSLFGGVIELTTDGQKPNSSGTTTTGTNGDCVRISGRDTTATTSNKQPQHQRKRAEFTRARPIVQPGGGGGGGACQSNNTPTNTDTHVH